MAQEKARDLSLGRTTRTKHYRVPPWSILSAILRCSARERSRDRMSLKLRHWRTNLRIMGQLVARQRGSNGSLPFSPSCSVHLSLRSSVSLRPLHRPALPSPATGYSLTRYRSRYTPTPNDRGSETDPRWLAPTPRGPFHNAVSGSFSVLSMQILHASNTRGFYFRILFPATFPRRFSHSGYEFRSVCEIFIQRRLFLTVMRPR